MTSLPSPLRGAIVDRYCLNTPGSSKEVWHLAVEIIESSLSFRSGDSVGIWPRNSAAAVQGVLEYFHLPLDTSSYLSEKVDLNTVSPSFVQLCAEASRDPAVAHERGEGYDVLQFLRTFVPHGVKFSEVQRGLLPIRPRLYSISSGPSYGCHRIELTVTRVAYSCNNHSGHGLCSHYLIQEAPLHLPVLKLFHQPSRHFSFPSDPKTPVLMVGSGSGIAPFRSFMQDVERGVILPPPCWLFFGGRRRESDFLYEEFWNAHVEAGRLRLDLAFSQDQEQKIYVQHKIWEQRKDFWQWLCDGASLLLCGNERTMAKDVDACVAKIAVEEGALCEEEALKLLRTLRHEGRYLRDVY